MRERFKTQDEIKYSTFSLSDRTDVRLFKIALAQDCYLLLTHLQCAVCLICNTILPDLERFGFFRKGNL